MPDARRQPTLGYLFIAAGTAMALLTLHSCWVWHCCQSWEAVPAELLAADLHSGSHSGRGGRNSTSVDVLYEYSASGTSYQSTKVSPFDWIEVSDSQKREQVRALRESADEKDTVTCYFDPDRPSRSILFREFRSLPVVVMTGVSLAFAGAGIMLVRQGRNGR